MKKRVCGLMCFGVGCGMVLALVVPALGWIFIVAGVCILLGYIMICG